MLSSPFGFPPCKIFILIYPPVKLFFLDTPLIGHSKTNISAKEKKIGF